MGRVIITINGPGCTVLFTEVESPSGMEAVQSPAAHPGRGAGGERGAGQGDGAHPGGGGGRGQQLQQRDVISEGGVTPGRPVRAPQAAAIKCLVRAEQLS